jgi:hypothetical protein
MIYYSTVLLRYRYGTYLFSTFLTTYFVNVQDPDLVGSVIKCPSESRSIIQD